jgi:hypothetical protein
MFYKNAGCLGWSMHMKAAGTIAFFDTYGINCTDYHSSSVSTPARYDDNGWHMATATVDRPAGSVKLYIDGVLKDTGSIDNTSNSINGQLRIGSDYNDGHEFAGSLDDARIYSRALSDAEIAALYNVYN